MGFGELNDKVRTPHLANPTIKPRCYSGRGGGFYPQSNIGLEEDGALQLVVAEQTLNGMPEEEGVLAIAPNHVEDAVGDRGEDPVDDAGVDHAPFAIVFCSGGGVRKWPLRPNLPSVVSKKRRHWP